ncbi:nucleoside phosphorylase [Paraburkholderia sp. BL6665CI2N2]|uniref:5'-methylthioadenosine/S-adenosylhomocysteine nucleosidase family protein n=1 Tax=Paraburkholderia sp. BL6665CI2N2 TaxID=1938806 RepID=UPI001065431E|nr:hypothetical protein [Paraburkholderia sp. BL6665CI2N2]TDY15759.1 nucleoside phosphorylase [Paraburkholderia sp. BL6665CI2N2]
MSYLVHLRWKVLLPFNSDFDPTTSDSKFFNLSGGKTFARSLGGDFQLETPPVVLSPTDLLHKALGVVKAEFGIEGHRFPYRTADGLRVNFALQCHGPILCVTVRLDPVIFRGTIADLAQISDLKKHKALWSLTRKISALALVKKGDASLRREPQVLPAIHIKAMEAVETEWLAQLVSLVTGHAEVSQEIVDSVVEKNEPHQLDLTRLLVDKQGISAFVPRNTSASAARASLARFESATAMLQLAAVLRLKLRSGAAITDDERAAILYPRETVTSSVSGSRVWSLFVIEFSLSIWLGKRSLPSESSQTSQALPMSTSSQPEPIRVLLFTVTPPETRALHNALRSIGREPTLKKINGFSYQNFGRVGDFEVFHQISGMGSGGIDGSQESIRRSIEAVKPQAVLMVGIAFGVKPEKQPIGTILVAKQIQTYDLQRVNADGSITLRGDKVTASGMLLNWVSHAEITWCQSSAKIRKGLVLSGEKLIDNRDYRDQLVKVAPEAIGGEMEGAGLYAASQLANVHWLLVKAVCDWADGNKDSETQKDEYQEIAAKIAAEFIVEMLRANSEAFP